jgi:transcriptional regulator with XRE-family HTH domain
LLYNSRNQSQIGGDWVKFELTLQEKLRDLRDERKLKLAELSEKTGIPVSTLQRMESDEDIRVGYQDVRDLARFYNVSADYLFGLTDNLQYRSIAVDDLKLSDVAIGTLKERKLNNRLVSELLSHPAAPQLFSAMEVYIDRKILPQMNTMNTVYKMAEEAIRENADISDEDETLKILQSAIVDEDEYLRFRITERFSALMKALFDAHKKDTLPDEQASVINEIKEGFHSYLENKETEGAQRAKLTLLAKQIGLNVSKLTDEEIGVLMKALRDSDLHKRARRKR